MFQYEIIINKSSWETDFCMYDEKEIRISTPYTTFITKALSEEKALEKAEKYYPGCEVLSIKTI